VAATEFLTGIQQNNAGFFRQFSARIDLVGMLVPRLNAHERRLGTFGPDAQPGKTRKINLELVRTFIAFQGKRFGTEPAHHNRILLKQTTAEGQDALLPQKWFDPATQQAIFQQMPPQRFRLIEFQVIIFEYVIGSERAPKSRMGPDGKRHGAVTVIEHLINYLQAVGLERVGNAQFKGKGIRLSGIDTGLQC
jgi:hypothetical protein